MEAVDVAFVKWVAFDSLGFLGLRSNVLVAVECESCGNGHVQYNEHECPDYDTILDDYVGK